MDGARARRLSHHRVRTAAQCAAVGVAYFVSARFGLSLASVHASASPVWPPAGIAIACLILFGNRLWPGVWLGALAANLLTEGTGPASFGIATGNTLEALAAAWLAHRFAGGRDAMERPGTILTFALGAGVAATLISATVGVASLWLTGRLESTRVLAVWETWWLGDLTGALIVAPLILVWAKGSFPAFNSARVLESTALVASVAAVSWIAFGPWTAARGSALPTPKAFFCIPPLVWAALRFGPRTTTLAAFLFDAAATAATLRGQGPFAVADPNSALLTLQAFMATISMTALVLAASVDRQRRSEAELAAHRDHLSELVDARTAQLAASHERLRLAERMSAMGTLAAGLGHDLGNLLLPLRARLDALRAGPLTPDARAIADDIARSIGYLNDLSASLRQFTRAGDSSGAPEGVSIHAWWEGAADLCRGVLPAHVRFEARLPDAPVTVHIARTPLTQAVFNLVQNAGDALRDSPGGRVALTADFDAIAGRLRIRVEDSGPGMTPDVLRRCTEPFFSTKPRANASGLGLSLVNTILRGCGGELHVESQPGRGSAFTLVLPASRPDSPAPATEPRPGAAVTIADRRTIGIASILLDSLGFEVKPGPPGADAGALVWLTEGRGAIARDVERFLAADPRRRVVLIGDADGVAPSARVVRTSPHASPSTLRDALAGVIRPPAKA